MAETPTPLAPKRPGLAAVIIRDAIEVQASRRFEWGPSEYVNSASWTLDDAPGGSGALRLEMQSGDVFVVRRRAIEAGRTPTPPSGDI